LPLRLLSKLLKHCVIEYCGIDPYSSCTNYHKAANNNYQLLNLMMSNQTQAVSTEPTYICSLLTKLVQEPPKNCHTSKLQAFIGPGLAYLPTHQHTEKTRTRLLSKASWQAETMHQTCGKMRRLPSHGLFHYSLLSQSCSMSIARHL
jgi:hypothetical protein